jgi:DNA-binding ferritin-like protein
LLSLITLFFDCYFLSYQLNEDIASSYVLFLQLRKQHVIIKGPDWKHIHDTLGEYATYIGKQAEELSERLTVLGGLPILILHGLGIWRTSTLKEMIC